MKKIFVGMIIIATIVGGLNGFNHWLNSYEKECEVIGVNNTIVECKDNHDEIWTFEDTEKHYSVGETIILEFTTNGTESLADDKVVDVK